MTTWVGFVINARDKGKRFELKIAKVWQRLFGGEPERTSYASKKLDDMGVDLTDTDPFNIQCKAVESSINYHAILERMPHGRNVNLIVHKRNHQPVVAAMYLEDLLELLQSMKREGIL